MGKPKGFMEYMREVPLNRLPLDRVKDWEEFQLPLDEEKQRMQGARCMECSIPFCHSGMLLNGMVSGCPLNNLVPEWNDLIYKGRWKDALDRLYRTNNFPEFTGRVCPAPCEGSCTLGLNGPQVTVKSNELAIISHAYSKGWIKPMPPGHRTGKKVAVVGSGPAGLACADQLNKAGHKVTVFERSDRIGGLLMYGIPNMKLDKKIVQRRVDLMEAEGIRYITGTEVGKDYPAEMLLKKFDAAVLCGGATRPRELEVEGRELKGVHFAVDYLSLNTKRLLDAKHQDTSRINAHGKDVIVIGGGDTGTDCVATSLRQGCRSVRQLEIMPCPPKIRPDNNPWPQWPRILKTDYGQEEAAAIYGQDPRLYGIMTKRLTGDPCGQVMEVQTVQVEWRKDAAGRISPAAIPGTEKAWPAQLVLICMGFIGPEDNLIKQLGIEQDERSNVKAEYGSFMTNIKGIFCAGDMRRGQSLVAWAINEGRAAARECDIYLMSQAHSPEVH